MSHRAIDISPQLQSDLSQFFKLLADETRLRVLVHLLHEGELHVSALCERLGQSQPAVSHHLAMLRLGKLIDVRREGKFNYYAVSHQRLTRLLDEVFQSNPEPAELRFCGLLVRRTARS